MKCDCSCLLDLLKLRTNSIERRLNQSRAYSWEVSGGIRNFNTPICAVVEDQIWLFKMLLCFFNLNLGRIPFAFLEDIHGRFVKTYGRACHTALAYAMNDEFSRVLNQQMDYYSNDLNADRINRIRGEMGQVRNVMIDNIDKVLERGDRLDLLVDKTANMQGNTIRFRRQARRFQSTVWWRNVRLTAALIVLLLIVIYVVLTFVCHGITLPSCVGH
ncbi:Vesicle-associated membrane protein 711 [Platanthera guangdongensis]|uniref:Vesicle-associated membrane protein 711 n=1 Tax=Platanthera guangdongensis TaxID=2320717 RepID=A0ABR2LVQ9_9ASPA